MNRMFHSISRRTYLFLILSLISIQLFSQPANNTEFRTTFTIENIEFKSGGVTLAGAIFEPKRPHAAVVIVHGSGQERRGIEFASRLAENGIAVLTYDKRGVGESDGVYAGPEVGTNNIDSANLNLLASDANAAAQVLLQKFHDRRLPLGLIGASQAGWVIPMAAAKNTEIGFMVIFSGPVVTTLEQLRFQFYTNGESNFWETHTEADVRGHIKNDADRYQFPATDPRNALLKLSIPGLWLYGGRDIQVPVRLSKERLGSLSAAGNPYEYQVFPELGHNTLSSKSPAPFDAAIKWIKSQKLHLKKR